MRQMIISNRTLASLALLVMILVAQVVGLVLRESFVTRNGIWISAHAF